MYCCVRSLLTRGQVLCAEHAECEWSVLRGELDMIVPTPHYLEIEGGERVIGLAMVTEWVHGKCFVKSRGASAACLGCFVWHHSCDLKCVRAL